MSTSSRKQDHVELALSSDVRFRTKTNGLDDVVLPYNALPEIDFEDVDPSVQFLGTTLSTPLMITGMTGGYPDAEQINDGLALACTQLNIAFGVGSMRAAVEVDSVRSTYGVVKQYASSIPIVANLGAVQVAKWYKEGSLLEHCEDLCSLIGASALAVHTNPLQELMQPEGQPQFRGVLDAIAFLVQGFKLPIIVKEVGAGITGPVAERLASVGVKIIDVAGAGGTSWAGVEILRRKDGDTVEDYWDVGTPTAQCLRQCKGLIPMLIASGGIQSGKHVAHSIALGATLCGMALPALQAFRSNGVDGVVALVSAWRVDLCRRMFLTGSQTLSDLARIVH